MVKYVDKRPSTIFVNVASYRDPECRPTVEHLFARARHPDRIQVCVVMQTEEEDGMLFCRDGVSVIGVRASESRGACWARYTGYRLLGNEDFVLQTDSHMRFAQDWDVRMIAQIERCPSERALLTTYPPAYEPPGDVLPEQVIFLAAEKFGADGHMTQIGRIHHPETPSPKRCALMSANFLFGRSAWARDVPYDPHLYFSGEETTLAARLWTSGWDLFGPGEPLVWHRYDRKGRRVHWDDHSQWYVQNAKSMARMRYLLAGDPAPDALDEIEIYGLGKERTLEQYRTFSGIDYAARTIAPHALEGEW